MENNTDVSRKYLRFCFEEKKDVIFTAGAQQGNAADINPLNEHPGYISSERAKEILIQHEASGAKQRFVRFCFRHRTFLKKIPFIGKKAIAIKNRKLQNSISVPIIDIEPYLGLYYIEFIYAAYKIMLERTPDDSGLASFSSMAKNGASNGAIAYAIAESAEFNNRAFVKNIAAYKKQYKRYCKKCRIKRMPVIGRIAKLYSVTNQLAAFQDSYEYNNNRLADAVFAANRKLDSMSWYFTAEKDRLLFCIGLQSEAIKELQSKVDHINDEIKHINNNINKTVNRQKVLAQKNQLISDELQELHGLVSDTMDSVRTDFALIRGSSEKLIDQLNKKSDNILSASFDISKKLESCSEFGEKVDEAIRLSYDLCEKEQKYVHLPELSQRIDELCAQQNIKEAENTKLISALHSKADNELSLSTSLSQKLDELPNFINSNTMKSKMVIPCFSGGVLSVIADDFIFGVPSEEWGLAASLSFNGHFEIGSEHLFEKLIKPDMTVLDIGANLGMYTLRALRAGCDVYSFEPTPMIYNIMCQNIQANGFGETGRSHAFNLAVSDREGCAEFNILNSVCGQNNNLFAGSGENCESISVRTAALDDLLSNVARVDVIKMDIEGAEFLALQGMKKIINNNPQIKMIMEFAPCHMKRAGVDPTEMLKLIRSFGFAYYSIDEKTGDLSQISDNALIECDSKNLLLTKDRIEI